jgi:uncharacterized SAM-dependent methyltransferase
VRSLARVTVHESQFPESVRRDFLESLRTRQLNHKFLYESFKQTQKWLALHRAYSPSRTDPGCNAIYQESFAALAAQLKEPQAHLIGLGCGGGQKDTNLLRLLRARGCRVFYTPSDVSVAMVLMARQAALEVVSEKDCYPLVCDLAAQDDLSAAFTSSAPHNRDEPTARVFTFFGMMPNFEPELILPKLARLIQPGDHLLLSANLAPGRDYMAGIKRVFPLYDNELTRDWLLTFLSDLGVENTEGDVRFVIEDGSSVFKLKRIAAYFHFDRDRVIEVEGERFEFRSRDSMRLFFSYRHTPELVKSMLCEHGLKVEDQWTTNSEDEGVFLVRRAP